MGLFDAKYCSICGKKLGLFGTTKLKDGNLCKDCAGKMSSLLPSKKALFVEEVKEHLAYREQNEEELKNFNYTRRFGQEGTILYVDEANRRFIASSSSNWVHSNPDIISFDQVRDVTVSSRESKSEVYDEDAEGKRISFDPPRYDYDYDLYITILLDHPWFNEIYYQMNYSTKITHYAQDLYFYYEDLANDISRTLLGREANITRNFGLNLGGYKRPDHITEKPAAQPKPEPVAEGENVEVPTGEIISQTLMDGTVKFYQKYIVNGVEEYREVIVDSKPKKE